MKLRDTIKEITRKHLDNNGLVCCQNLTGIGALQNTFPSEYNDNPNVIELPTSDVSNGAITTGLALSGRRTMYVIRFQGFVTYNAASIINYAAKSKEMWDVPCPLFVRSICNEGSIGPVASNCHHSVFMRMPGISVFAPITSKEWKQTWNYYMNNNDPIYCSEHRSTFDIDYDINDFVNEDNEVVLFAIGYGRVKAIEAVSQINTKCSVINIFKLKPLDYNPISISLLKKSKFGVVIDSDYTNCGAAESIAYELMLKSEKPVYVLGLENRTAGFAPAVDNVTPSIDKIVNFIKSIS